MKAVLRVRKKGVIILPKKLREQLHLEEGSQLIAEAMGGKIILRPLKPVIVDVDPELVNEILEGERGKEEKRYQEMIK